MIKIIRRLLFKVMTLPVVFQSTTVIAENSVFISPSPDLSAFEVVEIQLLGLKASGRDKMVGIEQVWLFAHPDNKRVTGPLERFAGLFENPAYAPLVGHSSASIEEIERQDGVARFVVTVLARDGQTYGYQWVLRLNRENGDGAVGGDIWMTSAVSAPKVGSAS